MEIVSMTCPNCMGPIKPIGGGYGKCEYCGAKFKLAGEEAANAEAFDEEEEEEEDDFDAAAEIEDYIGSRDCPPLKDMTDVWYGSRLKQDPGKVDAAYKYLGVPSDGDIILIVDNTLFHNGKKGLAITDYGIYLRDEDDDMESYTWEEFWDADVDPLDGHLSIDNFYFITDDSTMEGITGLFDYLQEG